jgi:hypothetical protein
MCKGEVDKSTEETLMKMVDDFPVDLLKKWLLEPLFNLKAQD